MAAMQRSRSFEVEDPVATPYFDPRIHALSTNTADFYVLKPDVDFAIKNGCIPSLARVQELIDHKIPCFLHVDTDPQLPQGCYIAMPEAIEGTIKVRLRVWLDMCAYKTTALSFRRFALREIPSRAIPYLTIPRTSTPSDCRRLVGSIFESSWGIDYGPTESMLNPISERMHKKLRIC